MSARLRNSRGMLLGAIVVAAMTVGAVIVARKMRSHLSAPEKAS